MDIRIGIKNSARELSFDSTESAAAIEKKVAEAIDNSTFVAPLAVTENIEIVRDCPAGTENGPEKINLDGSVTGLLGLLIATELNWADPEKNSNWESGESVT